MFLKKIMLTKFLVLVSDRIAVKISPPSFIKKIYCLRKNAKYYIQEEIIAKTNEVEVNINCK